MARLRGRPDSEHEMSFNRLTIVIIMMISIAALNPESAAIRVLACYWLASLVVFAHILFDQSVHVWRRLGVMMMDMAVISYCMYSNGAYAAGFWPIYLWVILGNGFRFGNAYLFATAAAAVIGFGLVVVATPFWNNAAGLSVGLLFGLIVLPAYTSQLIKKLSKAKLAAEEASRAKSYFLASVSHELRTPLTAIIGLGAHLRDSDLPAEQRNMAATVVTAGRSLLGLINQLLDFARLGARGMGFETKPFDLLPMLHSVRDLFKMSAEEKGLKLSVHVAACVPLRISGDKSHIRDVIVNLVGNAIKFTDSGSVTISADAERLANGSLRLIIAVADTGIGIAPEAQQHIFASFRQADETILDRFGGTGLGLAISKQVATLLGGEIGVDSVPGQGSRFWFTAMIEEAPQNALDTAPDEGELILFSSDGATISTMEALAGRVGIATGALASLDKALERALDPTRTTPCAILIDERECDRQAIRFDDLLAALDPRIATILLRAPEDGIGDAEAERNFAVCLTRDSNADEMTRALRIASTMVAQGSGEDLPAEIALPSCKLRILVADDNVMNQKVFSMLLSRAGHEVEVAENGETALDAMKDHGFDIVLMDVNMPVLNGIEATKLYRFTALGRKRIPIVGITADASPATAERCLDAGMDACISKPVEAAPLLQLIAKLTDPGEAPAVPSFDPSGVIVPLFRQEEPELPPINAAKITELVSLGGPEFVEDLLREYVADAESLIEMIRESVAEGDIDGFRNGTHALRSSGANIGADKVAELCRHYQRIERSEFDAKAESHLASLDAELERVREALVHHQYKRATVVRK